MGKKRGLSPAQIAEAFAEAERSSRHCNLHYRELDDRNAEQLAGLLAGSKVESLDLSENNIGDAGVIALAGALPHARRLTALNLADNNVGERGARYLAASVSETLRLESIELRQNRVSKPTLAVLAAAVEGACRQRVESRKPKPPPPPSDHAKTMMWIVSATRQKLAPPRPPSAKEAWTRPA